MTSTVITGIAQDTTINWLEAILFIHSFMIANMKMTMENQSKTNKISKSLINTDEHFVC